MRRRSPAPMLRPKPKHWHETFEPVAILRAIEIRSQVVQECDSITCRKQDLVRQDRAHDPCDAGGCGATVFEAGVVARGHLLAAYAKRCSAA
jgi:hypothetical protein